MKGKQLTGSPLLTWYYLSLDEQKERRNIEAEGKRLARMKGNIQKCSKVKVGKSGQARDVIWTEWYDQLGRVIKAETQRKDILDISTYEYHGDSQQVFLRKEHFSGKNKEGEEVDTHNTYEFNSAGDLVFNERQTNMIPNSKTVKEYAENGELLRETDYKENIKGELKKDCIRQVCLNEDGKPAVRLFFDLASYSTQEDVYAYDSRGNLIQHYSHYPIPGVSRANLPLIYDEEGNQLRGPQHALSFIFDGHLWRTARGGMPTQGHLYKYDEHNRRIEHTHLFQGKKYVKGGTEYDEAGNLILDWFRDSPADVGRVEARTYNDQGQWTLMSQYDGGIGDFEIDWNDRDRHGRPKITCTHEPRSRDYYHFHYAPEGYVRQIDMEFHSGNQLNKKQTEIYGPYFRLEAVHEDNGPFQQSFLVEYDPHGNPLQETIGTQGRIWESWEYEYA